MTIRKATCVTALAAVSCIVAQTPPAFDAASVKPVNPDNGAISFTRINKFMGSLQALIRFAYGLDDYRISGGPKWLDKDKFSIVYKPSGPQASLMLRTLLAERFQLVVHSETRQLPVYKLVLARSGAKMARADGPGGTSAGGGKIDGVMDMSVLASYLSSIVGRGVIDESGLKGAYNVALRWTPDDRNPSASTNDPSLVTAVQEQLGLQLESTKGPVDVLVIDRAEKPSGN